MLKKMLYGGVCGLALVPLFAFAQTTLDLQAEIAALLQQVQALQGELQSAVAPAPAPASTGSPQAAPAPLPTPSPTPVSSASAGCVLISRTLSLGSQGKEVTALQRYLASDPSLYPEGTVSGYFGALTERAVKRFQVQYGIVSSGSPSTTGYGAVGPRTRAFIMEKSCGGIPDVESGGTVPRCAINANRKMVLSGEPVTISWNSTNASSAVDNTKGERVELRGSTVFYPKVDSTFTYSFFGYTVSLPAVCSVRVSVASAESSPAPNPSPTPGSVVSSGDSFTSTPSAGGAPLYVQFIFKPKSSVACTSRELSIEYGDGESAMLESTLCASAGMRSVYHLYKKTGAFTARVYDNGSCIGNTRCGTSVEIAKTLIAVSGLSACTEGGVTIPHGASRDFYSAPSVILDEMCASRRLSRLCMDGVLSGAAGYSYSSCSEATSASCSLDGVTVANGGSRTFYSQSSVSSGTCAAVSQSRACTNGTLSGSATYNKAACVIAAPTCTLDGITLAHGSSTTFYFAQNVPAGELCSSYGQARACTNGTLSGSASYKYATCTPVSSNSCALDNVVVTNGSSATFFKYSNAPAGEMCSAHALSRTCSSGSLSGDSTYVYSACSNVATCTLDGATLGHSSSTVFYKARTVAFGSTCTSISLTRTCTNGKLSGDDTYQYKNCSVSAPVASLQKNLASAFLAAAQTASEIQTRIQALLKELAALQTQLLQSTPASDASSSQLSTSPTFRIGAACPVVSRNLRLGMRGEDVAALQRFLIAQGLLSAGSATGYYGALTLRAVQALQSGLGIVSSGSEQLTGWGVLGPKTRAALAEGCALMKTQYNASPTPPAGATPQAVPSSVAPPAVQKTASPPPQPPSPSTVSPSTAITPAVTIQATPAPSITISSPVEGAAFVVGDAIPVSWKTAGIPSGSALYLQLINSSNGTVVRSQKAGGSSASFSTSGACNGNFSDAPEADCAGLRSMIAKNLIFHFIQAVVYTPANGCLGFCAPGTPAATTLLTAKSGVFTLKSATFSASPVSGSADLEVTFSGNVPAGYFGGAEIDFGDASDNVPVCKSGFACTYQIKHTYTSSGTYTAKLKGVGEAGFSALGELKITVSSPPSASPCNTGGAGSGGQMNSASDACR